MGVCFPSFCACLSLIHNIHTRSYRAHRMLVYAYGIISDTRTATEMDTSLLLCHSSSFFTAFA